MTTDSGDRRLYVEVIVTKCRGYTPCADACPEVFTLDEDGFAYVESPRVPEGFEAKVRAAADACPEQAIYVGDVPRPQ